MSFFGETLLDQERTARLSMQRASMQRVNNYERESPGDLAVPEEGVKGSAAIPCANAKPPGNDTFEREALNACSRERADLIEHCERLQSANRRLQTLYKEMEDDLTVAARVQRHCEPTPIVWGRVRVDTFSQPARTVGGDFGMVCPLDDQCLNLLVCDVSGHGIGAALAASHIFSEASAHLQADAPLGDLLSKLNRSAIRNFNSSSFFFTVAAVRLDRSGRHMVFAGAGHPPCMLIKPGAAPRLLQARSMMLGALSNAVCPEPTIELNLEAGDRILLYTDGITEVFDAREEMLGVEGLQNIVRDCFLLPFDQMLPAILERVVARQHGPFVDDVTLVLAEIVE